MGAGSPGTATDRYARRGADGVRRTSAAPATGPRAHPRGVEVAVGNGSLQAWVTAGAMADDHPVAG